MWFRDLQLFFFPELCLVCNKSLGRRGEILCLGCEYRLPKTSFSLQGHLQVNQTLWGRVPTEKVFALFNFEKGSPYQALLHELKYRGNRRVGLYLGRMLGFEILHSPFCGCDCLVPVPLHKKRQKTRGYNQSEIIARGVSEITGIPLLTRLLIRNIHSGSQTSLGRYERFQNIKGNFKVPPGAPDINGLKILLIDDVITTGATMEACCLELLGKYNCRIYIATVSRA